MFKPRYSVDLIKQMAECDANYIRLLKLVPQLAAYRDMTLSKTVKENKDANDLLTAPPDNMHRDLNKNLDKIKVEFSISEILDSNNPVIVQITILESFRYTNTLEIIQKPEVKKLLTNPTMIVRIYHDASTAEVISSQGHENFQSRYPEKNPKMYHVDEKMRVNAFLGEWLTHCLQVGRSLEKPEMLVRI